MRELRGIVLLALAALLACRSEDEKARDAVEELFSADVSRESFQGSMNAVVDLGAASVPHLVERIANSSGYAAGAGLNALSEIGDSAVPALVRELDSDDPRHRLLAIEFLLWPIEHARSSDVIQRCVERLGDEDQLVRTSAAFGLVMRERRTAATAPILVAALRDADPKVRCAAALWLRDYRESVSDVVSGLLKATEDGVSEVQQAALVSLAGYWSADSRAVARIRETLTSDDPARREAALRALVQVQSPTPEIRQLCVTAAADEAEGVREAALEVLLAVWRKRPVSYAEHRTLLRHPDPDVRRVACEAVAFSRAVGVRDLQQLLSDDSMEVGVAAATALGILGEKEPSALTTLASLIADSDEDADITFGEEVAVRAAAAWALIERDHRSATAMRYLARNGYAVDLVRKYGPAAQPAAEEMKKILAESKSQDLAWALYLATGDATNSVEILRGTLSHGDGYHALRAAIHAARYGKGAAPLVPELTALLDHEHWGTRRYAATALGYIGEAAKPAIPKLIELLDDHDDGRCGQTYAVSRHAAAALAYLDVESPKVEALLRKVLNEWDSNDGNTRPGALRYAWKHGLRTPEGVARSCAGSLRPHNWDYALPIIRLLEEMGPEAKAAVGALRSQLDQRMGLRLAAQRALERIGPR